MAQKSRFRKSGWSISIDSSRAMARLVLKDDGIWAEFFAVGTVLFVR